jgi:putative ABC transport system permease protein
MPYGYNAYSKDFSSDEALTLKVVGILSTKDGLNYGSLSSGIYYTSELTDYVLEANEDSAIFEHIRNISEETTDAATAMMSYYFYYNYTFEYGTDENGETIVHNATGAVGPSMSMEDMMSSMTGSGSNAFDHKEMKDRLLRNLGANKVANRVSIYPLSFDDKMLVTDYLKAWNGDGDVTYGDVTISRDDRTDVTFTDTLELIINIINTMIDVISYALIAFTSISLVVSTVMIGIITYVSVVERIKEIGVIRALGGRKKDVSHLFNAETFIIGLLAGIIGVGATYLISVIVNLILKPLINYANIAALPIKDALLLVCVSIMLTLISGLIPASSAAKKDPVVALRTE